MVTTLWAFNIAKAKDASGNDVPIDGEYSDGMIRLISSPSNFCQLTYHNSSHPLPHACSVEPRSAEVEHVIKEAFLQTTERRLDLKH